MSKEPVHLIWKMVLSVICATKKLFPNFARTISNLAGLTGDPMPATTTIDYHVPIVGQNQLTITPVTFDFEGIKVHVASEKRNLTLRFTLITSQTLGEVRTICLGIIEKLSIGMAVQQHVILGIPNETAAQQIQAHDSTMSTPVVALFDSIGIADSIEITLKLDTLRAPSALRGYLTDKVASSVYGQLFLEAMRLQHPVAKFISLYHLVILLCGSDAQSDIDNYIISHQPGVQMDLLPTGRVRGGRTHETVHTKLRNELLHNRLGLAVDFSKASADMQTNLSGLLKIVQDGIRSIA